MRTDSTLFQRNDLYIKNELSTMNVFVCDICLNRTPCYYRQHVCLQYCTVETHPRTKPSFLLYPPDYISVNHLKPGIELPIPSFQNTFSQSN